MSMAPASQPQDGQADSSLPPTIAAFSPSTIAGSASTSRQRSSIIVHRKSPLLVATPPAITRALAYSHPFLLPLNKLVGLLTWTTGDPWQSFLLVATFWTVVLYSDAIILYAGPILVVVGLILGMYGRRYSPLSSTTSTGEKHRRKASAEVTRHQKSLDDIVETLRTLTTRCHILLEPLLDLTDFLSTQRTPTSATTRPALTALFIRILLVTPVWIILTLPPFYIITTRRVVMCVGTIILTYHSRPARVSRVILWRSRAVRRLVSIITGLSVADGPHTPQKSAVQGMGLNISTRRRGNGSGVRFTFVVYENQRRWLGIGWTYSLFPAERGPWTDEHLNTVLPKDKFELPDVQTGDAKWRWVEGSEWRVEGGDNSGNGKSDSKGPSEGWIYYDNKWNDGRRGQDGWDRYTRRRKWYRDAELVDTQQDGPSEAVSSLTQALEREKEQEKDKKDSDPETNSLSPHTPLKARRRRWFGSKDSSKESSKERTSSGGSIDAGRTTSANFSDATGGAGSGRGTPARPVSIQNTRRQSQYSVREGSMATSDSASTREKEMASSHDRHDKWSTRAAGGTERAEREMGLSDEVQMALS
ncbi:Peroxisomal membrane protein PEX30 [Penicillium subrubescens]|uniref:Peroxisomal membrane protein PEX30 n=1 Tax=Penicillium subrubescens TaxID=1316194 RepID=A0A1Q5T2T3_9EURO|nr:Peroxisomal membrane protein PEX30 [Penicillium subrubescens]